MRSLNLSIQFIFIISVILILSCQSDPKQKKGFQLEETTIAQIHEAMKSGQLTCKQLVEMYIKRIEIYDHPTILNAIVVMNPNALNRAEALDKEFQETGKLRPLHGIPLIVKDNYDTHDLQTAGGSLAMKGSLPPDDAFQIRKLREAGAIVLAKSNMAEWAFSPYQTVSSLMGTTRNPYDKERVPAGSSGGTAAAVAANLGSAGLGTDTGNSIRGPSSHNCLVGIRSTMGLTSRDGIIPLYLRNDIGGPICRSVEDAVRILEVIAGFDPADPITRLCRDKVPENYTQYLDADGLKGKRIGVFRHYIDDLPIDTQVKDLMEHAIEDLKKLGAEIVDPLVIPDIDTESEDIWCDMFQYDVNNYLASLGENAVRKSLKEIVDSGLYAPYIEERIKDALKTKVPPEKLDPPCGDLYTDPRNIALRKSVLAAMKKANVDALVYPSWNFPPRKVGDMDSPAGDNSQILSPHTGLPAITVPMGFTYGRLPAGIQFLGKLFGEPDLISMAYAYEQGTKLRRPPKEFPSLEDE